MSREEYERQKRLTDQLLTAYSVLRDRYSFKATLLTISILSLSVILCTCTFLPDNALRAINISEIGTRVLLATLSSFVFIFSLIELVVDWRTRAKSYSDAAELLATLKSKQRLVKTDEWKSLEACALIAEYNSILEKLPRILDAEFVGLKAYHLSKIELSKMIDEYPGCPLFVLKWRLLWKSLKK